MKSQKDIVLLVDDNPTNLGVLYNTLVQQGYKILVAQDGESALCQIKQRKPDLILLDVMMPGLDGFETCRRIKQNESTEDIPVLFMTSLVDTENKVKGFEVGAVDYITKPIQAAEVLARVKTHLSIRRLQQNLEEKNGHILSQNAEIQAQRDTVMETNTLLERALRDLTTAQERMVHSEKMATIGQLVAGLAHEINNPLGVIQSAMNFIKQAVDKTEMAIDLENDRQELNELLSIHQAGVERIRKIVLSLLEFSHADKQEPEKVSLHDELDQVIMALNNEFADRICLLKNYGRIPLVDAYPGKLNQAFFHILRNAIQAIPERGKITVTTHFDGEAVLISFKDSGVGIHEDHLNKIFDPFFTTRDVGEGMGLGLSMCYAVIRSHGGDILVESEQGNGCEISIFLPASTSQLSAQTPPIELRSESLVS